MRDYLTVLETSKLLLGQSRHSVPQQNPFDVGRPSWKRMWMVMVQVVAGACDPMSCTVFSLEPAIPLWRETFQVRVQAKDRFGNLLPVGGDSVDGFLEGPDGVSDRPDHVEDHGNGTYTIYCMLNAPGELVHEMTCTLAFRPRRIRRAAHLLMTLCWQSHQLLGIFCCINLFFSRLCRSRQPFCDGVG